MEVLNATTAVDEDWVINKTVVLFFLEGCC